jgi:hypothetical protein
VHHEFGTSLPVRPTPSECGALFFAAALYFSWIEWLECLPVPRKRKSLRWEAIQLAAQAGISASSMQRISTRP